MILLIRSSVTDSPVLFFRYEHNAKNRLYRKWKGSNCNWTYQMPDERGGYEYVGERGSAEPDDGDTLPLPELSELGDYPKSDGGACPST